MCTAVPPDGNSRKHGASVFDKKNSVRNVFGDNEHTAKHHTTS